MASPKDKIKENISAFTLGSNSALMFVNDYGGQSLLPL